MHSRLEKAEVSESQELEILNITHSSNLKDLLSSLHLDKVYRPKLISLFLGEKVLNLVSTTKELNQVLFYCCYDYQLIFEKIGDRIYEIVESLFDTREIEKRHLPALFLYMGLDYVASLVDCHFYLVETLPQIDQSKRLGFIKSIGFDKVRGFIRNDKEYQAIYKLMPAETHRFLDQNFKLFDAKLTYLKQKNYLPPLAKKVYPLVSKTGYQNILFPNFLDDKRLVGLSAKVGYYYGHLIVYNVEQDCIEYLSKNNQFKEIYKISENTFLVNESDSNELHEFQWTENKLKLVDQIKLPTHTFGEERIMGTINYTDQKWFFLRVQMSGPSNKCKSWFLDALDLADLSVTREFSSDVHQHTYVDSLALLPDGKTLIAWDSGFNNHKNGSREKTFEFCLIDIATFKAQTITLPLESEIEPLNKVNFKVNNNSVNLEISFTGDSIYVKPLYDIPFTTCYDFSYKILEKQKILDEKTKSIRISMYTFFNNEEINNSQSKDAYVDKNSNQNSM